MARIKIDIPSSFIFSANIPVRITDINYGGHVGNDTVLSMIHEARVQFLQHFGYSELKMAGTGIIMSDVGIEYKNELFYGDMVKVSVAAGDFSKISFDLYYKLEKESNGKTITVAVAKTGIVCYNYDLKKVVAVPEEVKEKLTAV
ncbi:MAG: thioesterase family protein [Chitinophagaceae bacterium]